MDRLTLRTFWQGHQAEMFGGLSKGFFFYDSRGHTTVGNNSIIGQIIELLTIPVYNFGKVI